MVEGGEARAVRMARGGLRREERELTGARRRGCRERRCYMLGKCSRRPAGLGVALCVSASVCFWLVVPNTHTPAHHATNKKN